MVFVTEPISNRPPAGRSGGPVAMTVPVSSTAAAAAAIRSAVNQFASVSASECAAWFPHVMVRSGSSACPLPPFLACGGWLVCLPAWVPVGPAGFTGRRGARRFRRPRLREPGRPRRVRDAQAFLPSGMTRLAAIAGTPMPRSRMARAAAVISASKTLAGRRVVPRPPRPADLRWSFPAGSCDRGQRPRRDTSKQQRARAPWVPDPGQRPSEHLKPDPVSIQFRDKRHQLGRAACQPPEFVHRQDDRAVAARADGCRQPQRLVALGAVLDPRDAVLAEDPLAVSRPQRVQLVLHAWRGRHAAGVPDPGGRVHGLRPRGGGRCPRPPGTAGPPVTGNDDFRLPGQFLDEDEAGGVVPERGITAAGPARAPSRGPAGGTGKALDGRRGLLRYHADIFSQLSLKTKGSRASSAAGALRAAGPCRAALVFRSGAGRNVRTRESAGAR